jgi:hypothetical protein
LKTDDTTEFKSELTHAERRQIEYAEGWMMLGNPVEAEREMDQINPQRAHLSEVISKRFVIYDEAGWTEKRDALCPPIRTPIGRAAFRVVRAFGCLCAALVREGWKQLRGKTGEKK